MSSKSKLVIGPSAIVCRDCELKGEIAIGSRTVIHPRAQILAESGPIIIGENNLIEERVVIVNRAEGMQLSDERPIMVIGNNNVFEVGCVIEAVKIGDNNVLEPKSRVGRNTELTSGCVVGAKCEVSSPEVISENTVIFGSQCERRLQNEKPSPQNLQLDFLSKILPNYHAIRKPTKPI